jgi:dTDP-4-dehydrorhamnose reductase
MKVVLLGKDGQVGRAFLSLLAQHTHIHCVAFGRSEADFFNAEGLRALVLAEKPDVVVNAAAYTQVDLAEEQAAQAFQVNATAVWVLAKACAEIGACLIHISTDYIFSGKKSAPYMVEDAAEPINEYGHSKWEGECYIRAQPHLNYIIIRTAWVYSCFDRNFLHTMLRVARSRDVVRVVSDQVGTPTSAHSLAGAMLRCIEQFCEQLTGQLAEPYVQLQRVYHWTDAGIASWYDFAVAIMEEAFLLGLLPKKVEVEPISSAEYPTKAKRPTFSVLDKTATFAALGTTAKHWRVALREELQRLTL